MTPLTKMIRLINFILLFFCISGFSAVVERVELTRDTIAEVKIIIKTFNQLPDSPVKKEAAEILTKLNSYTELMTKDEEINFSKKQIYKFIVEYPIKPSTANSIRLKDVLRLEKKINDNPVQYSPLAHWITSALIKDYKALPQVPIDDPKVGPVIKTREKILKNWFIKLVSKDPREINTLFEEVLVSCLKSYLQHLKLLYPFVESSKKQSKPLFSFVMKKAKKPLNYIEKEAIKDQNPPKEKNDWKPKDT